MIEFEINFKQAPLQLQALYDHKAEAVTIRPWQKKLVNSWSMAIPTFYNGGSWDPDRLHIYWILLNVCDLLRSLMTKVRLKYLPSISWDSPYFCCLNRNFTLEKWSEWSLLNLSNYKATLKKIKKPRKKWSFFSTEPEPESECVKSLEGELTQTTREYQTINLHSLLPPVVLANGLKGSLYS